jgi:hypothetical protein
VNPDENRRRRRVDLLVRLYPSAWRRRYGDEFAALLLDTGVGARVVRDVLLAAAAAWARPPARLHTRGGRMRATVGVTLCAWTVLAAAAVLFGKLTRDGAVYIVDRADPVRAWCYDVFAAAGCASAVVMLGCGLVPLAVATLRACPPGRSRRRVVGLLAAPALAVSGFLAAAAAVARVAGAAGNAASGVGPGGFAILVALGLLAAAVCALAPVTALADAPPRGAALVAAVVAGMGASVLMAIAILASLGYELAGLGFEAAMTVGGFSWAAIAGYAAVTVVALAVATTSSARGMRALRAPAARQ